MIGLNLAIKIKLGNKFLSNYILTFLLTDTLNSSITFSQLTGITVQNFNEIYELAERHYIKERNQIYSLKVQIFLTLIYLRIFPPQFFLAFTFQIPLSSLSRIIQKGKDILLKVVTINKWIKWESEDYRYKHMVRFKGCNLTALVDGVEQRIYKSGNREIERSHYSGKKRFHSFTKLIVVTPRGTILFLSQSTPGAQNDLNLVQKQENKFWLRMSKNEAFGGDKIFAGLAGKTSGVKLVTPITKKELLSDEEVTFNNQFSSYRIVVENVIRSIKCWKSCADQFRAKGESNYIDHECTWTICASLYNHFVAPIRHQ